MAQRPQSPPTAQARREWFLYQLTELEQAVERHGEGWDIALAKLTHERLAKLTARTHEMVARLGGVA
jgi:hypothetical protein